MPARKNRPDKFRYQPQPPSTAEVKSQASEYQYRCLPLRGMTWCITGEDTLGGTGVLEWCADEKDAQEILKQMRRFPRQFKNLHASPWEGEGMERTANLVDHQMAKFFTQE